MPNAVDPLPRRQIEEPGTRVETKATGQQRPTQGPLLERNPEHIGVPFPGVHVRIRPTQQGSLQQVTTPHAVHDDGVRAAGRGSHGIREGPWLQQQHPDVTVPTQHPATGLIPEHGPPWYAGRNRIRKFRGGPKKRPLVGHPRGPGIPGLHGLLLGEP